MTDPAALFEQLVAEQPGPGIGSGRMFGCDALTVDGKVAAVLQSGQLCCRLGAGSTAHAAALTEPGAALWDPHDNGRVFRDWVRLPTDLDVWRRYAAAAVAALGG
jgi:TfoX/Sxy family transcriptional regulator of competence genes